MACAEKQKLSSRKKVHLNFQAQQETVQSTLRLARGRNNFRDGCCVLIMPPEKVRGDRSAE